jgi:hypothetical protein
MFRKPIGFVSRTGALTVLLTALLSLPAFAQAPTTGLGQPWPNATDVSLSPHYHVYVFVRDGIRYIQVNDISGTVRAAVAIADNVVIALPMGADASYVTTQHSASQLATWEHASMSETVYSDTTTSIIATLIAKGAIRITVITRPAGDPTICTNPPLCTNRHDGD